MAGSITSKNILLSLPYYVSAEYDEANKSLGEIWTYRLEAKSGIAKTSGLLIDIADPLVYSIFALRAASRRISGSIASGISNDAFSMGGLTLLKQAGTALADEVSTLAYTLDDVRQHCTQVLQFYRALDVQPLLKQPEAPIQYLTQVAQDSTLRSVVQGKEVELRNVSFKYPGSERFALDAVSFKVKPGSLVCIVGYNGAGKSTLIDLICRVVDPSLGEFLINGMNAKDYASADLYHKISCQFQSTFPADVTLREFLHMGDVIDQPD
ncbi:MAG: hypothetical protein CYPHOPRED_003053 [Cyphobasidiales sp. Tagirdzhanova-0007]|nr:MAG: hypothetical protein CYPHOPRED_003053 [Cyphobasidiales sp. Tagirdzhanova-0007]